MSEQFLIEDGYTVPGKIPRSPGIHPELSFVYRPALSTERHAYLRSDSEKRTKAMVKIVMDHVNSWSMTDRKGDELSTKNATIIERIQPTLLERIVDIILGYAPSGEEEADAKNS